MLERRNGRTARWRSRYFIKFKDARLHAVSSRNMYSLHGFDALIRARVLRRVPAIDRRVVLHPGIAAVPVESAISIIKSRGPQLFIRLPVDDVSLSTNPCPRPTARMKSSVTRTEWFGVLEEIEP